MRFRTCSALLLLLLLQACAATAPRPDGPVPLNRRIANLQRAVQYPWTDDGQCVVREASNDWDVLGRRCFHALDRTKVQIRDVTGRCALVSAGAVVAGVALCVFVAPEIIVGAIIVTSAFVVAGAIQAEIDAYKRSAARERARPKTQTRPSSDDAHNKCADRFPPNRYPGNDVLVDGKLFDALQVGVRVLWEIKTERFDTYSPFLQNQVIIDEVEELRRERDIAVACGYRFIVGVSTAEHKAALEEEARDLEIVVTECKR